MLICHTLSISRPLCGPRNSPQSPRRALPLLEARRAEGRHSPWRPFCFRSSSETISDGRASTQLDGRSDKGSALYLRSGRIAARLSWRGFDRPEARLKNLMGRRLLRARRGAWNGWPQRQRGSAHDWLPRCPGACWSRRDGRLGRYRCPARRSTSLRLSRCLARRSGGLGLCGRGRKPRLTNQLGIDFRL